MMQKYSFLQLSVGGRKHWGEATEPCRTPTPTLCPFRRPKGKDESSIGERNADTISGMDERKERKALTTFSIEPSFKKELTEMFASMGLGWASGVRFALKEFQKNQEKNRKQ